MTNHNFKIQLYRSGFVSDRQVLSENFTYNINDGKKSTTMRGDATSVRLIPGNWMSFAADFLAYLGRAIIEFGMKVLGKMEDAKEEVKNAVNKVILVAAEVIKTVLLTLFDILGALPLPFISDFIEGISVFL